MQVTGERARDIGKATGLGEWLHFRGEQTDGELLWHGARLIFGRKLTGYDAAMRRLLIGLTVTLLVVVSIGVGVAVARWPHPHLWP